MPDLPITPMLMTNKVERYTEYALNRLTTRLAKDGQPYAFITDEKNRIAHPLQGKWLKHWLRKAAKARGDVLRNDDLKEITENILAQAALDEERSEIYLRVGRNVNGNVELDSGNDNLDRILFKDGKAVVTSSGSKTLFTRPETMLPLPEPATTGDWKLLFPFLNMSEEHKYLVVGCMSYDLTHPRGSSAYPILVAKGPQGAGKSEFSRGIYRLFVDNNAADIQLLPAKMKDMVISARSQYVLIYDNVREIKLRQSDDLCVMSTGGTISSRRLFTDHDEVMLPVHAPVASPPADP